MRYELKVQNNKYLVLKTVILAICLLCELILLASIISAISSRMYIDILWYVLGLIIIIGLQLVSTFLTCEYKIQYQNCWLELYKNYPLLSKKVAKAHIKDIDIVCYDLSEKEIKAKFNDKKIIRLYSNSCSYKICMIELSGQKYIINSDDYLYSLIEVKDDIS